MLISFFMFRVEWRFKCLGLKIVVKSCIFAKSLMGTIMQDGGTRERSENDYGVVSSSSKIKRKEKKNQIKKISKFKVYYNNQVIILVSLILDSFSRYPRYFFILTDKSLTSPKYHLYLYITLVQIKLLYFII